MRHRTALLYLLIVERARAMYTHRPWCLASQELARRLALIVSYGRGRTLLMFMISVRVTARGQPPGRQIARPTRAPRRSRGRPPARPPDRAGARPCRRAPVETRRSRPGATAALPSAS